MLYPEHSSEHLDPALFAHPTAAYRGIPFWSWNCTVTEQLIDEQLDIFKAMGFGGVDIHPRSDLNTAYLSGEYMRLVRFAVQQCKEKGLLCWLYDDDRFPSGAAGGLLTREKRFRQRFLLLTEQRREDCHPDREAFDRAIAEGGEARGWFAAAYAVTGRSARRIQPEEPLLPEERLRWAYVMLLEEEDWFQGATYADVMNPETVRAFIAMTHEAYFREVGEDFGGAVPAIFTDEPRMETRTNRHPKQLCDADSHADVILPWSDALRARLREDAGADLLDMAPALVWELPDSPRARWLFRNAACEQFAAAYMDQIAAWCRGHHILMTGHVLSEDSLSAQASSLGECMRCYRGMDLPGIDVLCDERQFLAAKQAASVAHQMGREGVVSELYGVTQWNCDFKTFKLQGDWQAALGVTIRVPHLAWMSMEGEAKRDWPGSIFYQAPWWKEFCAVEDYFARLNTALTRGKPCVATAVLHPVESVWLHQGNQADTRQRRQEMDRRFDGLVKALLANLTDFDLISEAMLPDQHAVCDATGLHVGDMAYRTVIVPDMDTIRSSTLDVLECFRQQGGRVIFAGKVPTMVDARPSDRARQLAAACARTPFLTDLAALLDQDNPVGIRRADGGKAVNLLLQLRQDGAGRWLFLCQAWPRRSKMATPEQYTVRIRGAWNLTLYDALTGDIRPWHSTLEQGDTVFTWEAYAQDSLLLYLAPGHASTPPPPARRWVPCAILFRPDRVRLAEPNMLLLDYARASLDGGELSPRMEILRLDNELRRQVGFSPRYGSMMQPYAMEEGEVHRLSLRYEINADCALHCDLGIEHPEVCDIRLNGEAAAHQDHGWYVDKAIRRLPLPPLRPGVNQLDVSMPYHQKTNLESLYLLGNFDVMARPAGESLLLPRRADKGLGDLTRQGLPFYSGVVTYSFTFQAPQGACYALQVPSFAAALLVVRVDGWRIGQIACAPHRLTLGVLRQGTHRLEVDAYIGRHNGFGPLHNSNDDFVWYGPDAWRTRGDEWTDDYRLLPGGLQSAVEVLRLC